MRGSSVAASQQYPRGSKSPACKVPGPKYQDAYGFWNQKPPRLDTWTLWVKAAVKNLDLRLMECTPIGFGVNEGLPNWLSGFIRGWCRVMMDVLGLARGLLNFAANQIMAPLL